MLIVTPLPRASFVTENKRQVFDQRFRVSNSLVSLGEISRTFTKNKFLFSVKVFLGDIYSNRGAERGSVQSALCQTKLQTTTLRVVQGKYRDKANILDNSFYFYSF